MPMRKSKVAVAPQVSTPTKKQQPPPPTHIANNRKWFITGADRRLVKQVIQSLVAHGKPGDFVIRNKRTQQPSSSPPSHTPPTPQTTSPPLPESKVTARARLFSAGFTRSSGSGPEEAAAALVAAEESSSVKVKVLALNVRSKSGNVDSYLIDEHALHGFYIRGCGSTERFQSLEALVKYYSGVLRPSLGVQLRERPSPAFLRGCTSTEKARKDCPSSNPAHTPRMAKMVPKTQPQHRRRSRGYSRTSLVAYSYEEEYEASAATGSPRSSRHMTYTMLERGNLLLPLSPSKEASPSPTTPMSSSSPPSTSSPTDVTPPANGRSNTAAMATTKLSRRRFQKGAAGHAQQQQQSLESIVMPQIKERPSISKTQPTHSKKAQRSSAKGSSSSHSSNRPSLRDSRPSAAGRAGRVMHGSTTTGRSGGGDGSGGGEGPRRRTLVRSSTRSLSSISSGSAAAAAADGGAAGVTEALQLCHVMESLNARAIGRGIVPRAIALDLS